MFKEFNIPKISDPEFSYLNNIVTDSSELFLKLVSPINLNGIKSGIAEVEKIVRILSTDEISEGKTGGILCVGRRGKNGLPLLVVQIGSITSKDYGGWKEKVNQYTFYAMAKAIFLGQHPRLKDSGQNLNLHQNVLYVRRDLKNSDGKLLRYQPRVPSGGIALLNNFVISYSAYKKSEMDTAISMAMAHASVLASESELDNLARSAQNNIWPQIKRVFLK